MNAISQVRSLALSQMLADVADAASSDAPRHLAIADVLARHVGNPDLLAGIACEPGESCYRRHLLHADPAGGYACVAIVWRPGQMSPVHGHRTWCALGVHRGWLTETFFRPEGGIAVPTSCRPMTTGIISHAPADPEAIHRIANLGTETAISIHVYGVAFDRFGDGVNEVWAA